MKAMTATLPATPAHAGRRDATVLGIALLAVLAWDALAWDHAVSQALGGRLAFPLRDAASWASQLHEAGRWVSGLLLVALVLHAGWSLRAGPRGPRSWAAWAAWTAAATVAVMAAVPALKRASSTSCPWDLADFGGHVPYLPHWPWLPADGGPGHCFPSGHAVAAFAFLVPALAWRRQRPVASRRALVLVLAAGAVFGAVQVLRGAHFVSHVLWSAWLCALLAVLADAVARRLEPRPA